MRKIIMILVMAMVAFGSFAKDFEYKANDEQWTYDEKGKALFQYYKWPQGEEYRITYFDVSEEDAWKIINGEEFPTFEFRRYEYPSYDGTTTTIYIHRMPCRDYSNRR